MHQYRWNGLQSQIWMTAKIAELQRSVKVHREKSGTFSQKVSAKLSVLPQDATQPQPLQCPLGCLEVFNFSTRITLFSCLQLWTKNTKEVTLWVTSEVFTHVRARQKSVTCSKTQSQPRKTKCAPKVRRESVWLFPTASIFQTHQAVKLLYLKSIYFYHPSRDIRWTILFPRNQEELLEQLTVSLGHVECRHSHYPATPPVYRSEKIVNPVFNASGRLDFLPG